MKTFTHIGVIEGCDNRTPDGYQRRVYLRESQNFWITKHGSKYQKKTGWGMGDWPLYSLKIDSIQPLQTPVKLP